MLIMLACGVLATLAGEAAESRQLTADSPMAELLDNPAARAVLEQELPALLAGPQIEQSRPFSLRALQVYAPTVITDEKLQAVDVALVGAGAVGSADAASPVPQAPVDNREALTLVTRPLWEGPAPGATGEGPEHIPTLTIVRPDGATSFGTAVIVAPGGGYMALATGHEGRQVADWFAAHGITAFVLSYAVTGAGELSSGQLCIAGDETAPKEIMPVQNVSLRTPPTFIFHTSTDELVPPAHATAFYDALRKADVPAELHIFGEGRHGLGFAMTDPALEAWPSLLASWLRGQRLIGQGLLAH